MWNHLVHAYFDVDIRLTWKTVTDDLPVLVTQLRQLLSERSL